MQEITILALLVLIVSCVTAGAGGQVPALYVPRTAVPPELDGDLSDPAWQTAAGAPIFVNWATGQPTEAGSRVLITWDDTALYVAFDCAEPNMHALKATQTERDSVVWSDDCGEIFIQSPAADTYYHIVVNALGTVYDGERMKGGWDSDTRGGGRKGENGWTAEVAIPWKDIGGAPTPGDQRNGNFGRERRAGVPTTVSAWSFTGGPLHNELCFGRMLFVDSAPVVQRLDLGARTAGLNRLTAEVRGPAAGCTLSVRSIPGTDVGTSMTVTGEPSHDVAFRYPLTHESASRLLVTLSNGTDTFFRLEMPTAVDPVLDVDQIQSALEVLSEPGEGFDENARRALGHMHERGTNALLPGASARSSGRRGRGTDTEAG